MSAILNYSTVTPIVIPAVAVANGDIRCVLPPVSQDRNLLGINISVSQYSNLTLVDVLNTNVDMIFGRGSGVNNSTDVMIDWQLDAYLGAVNTNNIVLVLPPGELALKLANLNVPVYIPRNTEFTVQYQNLRTSVARKFSTVFRLANAGA